MKTKFSPVAPLFETDAYKLGHRNFYLMGGNVTRIYSNYTNRKSRYDDIDHVIHFGLQAFLQKYAMDAFEPFFAATEDEVAALYEERTAQILGPNNIGSDHIRALHRKGFLPLEFRAVPEGTLVPIGVPSFTVENTDDEFFWLTNYVETVISQLYWAVSTNATIAHRMRKFLDQQALETTGQKESVDFQGHDFSARGMSSDTSSAMSGAAWLTSFKGSDSLGALEWIDYFYPGEDNGFIAGSVAATEHSVMCAGSAILGELGLFRNIVNETPGIVSIVSDTWDLWRVLTDYMPTLKDEILARDGKVVIRPDSGDPVLILTGDPEAPEDHPARRGVVQLLWDTFGGTVNEQGFKELDTHVGAIYGDSITYERMQLISRLLRENGFATTNVVYGVGSFTMQFQTRDGFSSAMKATWALVDGKPFDLLKDPVTDNGTKKSATGRLAVVEQDGDLVLIQKATPEQEAASLLQPVWRDGKFLVKQSFNDVRERIAASKF